MAASPHVTDHRAPGVSSIPVDAASAAIVLRELERILESPPFRGSPRRKQFLSYVVRHSLEGRHELLKERVIGAEVFQLDADYATGDNPVVRVQAGEVRRRLEQCYHNAPPEVPVRIEIPLGSYCAVFHWQQAEHPSTATLAEASRDAAPAAPLLAARRSPKYLWLVAAGCLLVILAAAIATRHGLHAHSSAAPTAINLFWSPVFKTPQPVIICLAKPVVYRPSLEMYRRYTQKHPGTFETEPERDNEILPLDPETRMTWGDMEIYPGYGVASGDTFAAVQISKLLVRIGKPSQLRIGKGYSFEDLRTSPAVIVGAFNNRWTMQMTAGLHFALSPDLSIQEQGPVRRTWQSQFDTRGAYTADYGVLTRLLNAKTGQFLISAAGVGSPGTQAAGELVSNPDYLAEALRNAPAGWDSKNIQLVVQTNVIDSIPGPPRVVAAYYW